MSPARMAERLWWGTGPAARTGRLALAPISALWASAMRARNALYDSGGLRSHPLSLPAISVGNVTVGGTGKTPVAAWIASRLRAEGHSPALVLRGYGDDERLVHGILAPQVPVVVGADRVEAVGRARAQGADVVVLDDAFQHRRARRDLDVVLVSADRWTGQVRVLPAGPWREPLRGLRRAGMILVTRKAVSTDDAGTLAARLEVVARGVPTGVVALLPDGLRGAGIDEHRPLEALHGAGILAIAAIGDPSSFVRQLAALGARVSPAIFPDHHAFDDEEIARLAARATAWDLVVCTLKDAVKLSPRWPRQAPPLWYVSQRVVLERGEHILAALLAGAIRSGSALVRTAAPLR